MIPAAVSGEEVPVICEQCWAVVVECACCAGSPDGCSCGVTVCVSCAEAACDDDVTAAAVA